MNAYKLDDFSGCTLNERALQLLQKAVADGNGLIPFCHGFPGVYGYEVIAPRVGGVHKILARFDIDGEQFFPEFEHAILPRD